MAILTRLQVLQNQSDWLKILNTGAPLTTPYIVTDLSVVRQKIAEFRKRLPDVELFYATKSSSDPVLLQNILQLVDGFDIASAGEHALLEQIGVEPSKFLFSNPVKIPSHIQAVLKAGVNYFAFDSLMEIEKLKKYAPGSNVFLRLRVADYGSKFPLSKKFGVDPLHAMAFASEAQDAGLNVVGVAFHVGSQSENLQVWPTAFEIASETLVKMKKAGMQANFLNIGGGFPADYGDPIPSFKEVTDEINKAIKKYVPPKVRIVAEPGRFISANASTLVSTVIGREHRSGSDWLYLDMGVFQGLIESLEMPNWKYPIFTDKSLSRRTQKSFILTGPTCDAYDTIGTDYFLPSEINIGDRVYIGAVGAYSLVYASNFNGFEPPVVYYVGERTDTDDSIRERS